MQYNLLPADRKQYKANLHMHTCISDGEMTPEEVRRRYMEQGYSVVAFSDHEVMVPHPELTDENFLALTSYEVFVNEPKKDVYSHLGTYHFNLFAPELRTEYSSVFNERYIWKTIAHAKAYVTDEARKAAYERKYDTDSLNDLIARANADGFLVCYNHPVWSSHDFTNYGGLKGLWGVECFNTGCALVGLPDTDRPLDDLLKRGERVFPVASDDAHEKQDCFGGFVMICAEKLDYPGIFAALKNGDFYASCGPLISALSLKDGTVHIETTDAQSIALNTDCRTSRMVRSTNGTPLRSADFDLKEFLADARSETFFRLTVTDPTGKKAYTRAYFADEL